MEWFWIALIFLVMFETFIVGCIVIYYGNKILQQNHKEDHNEPKKKRSCDNCDLVRSARQEGRQEGKVQTLETANRFLHDWSVESKKREKEIFNKLCKKINALISMVKFYATKINDADYISVYVLLDEIEKFAKEYGLDLDELEEEENE